MNNEIWLNRASKDIEEYCESRTENKRRKDNPMAHYV